ncbi:MAG: hypothetical protein GXO90_02530 [FCB group bacterium]|nr:hypothetical protein [FCB group bacterium]
MPRIHSLMIFLTGLGLLVPGMAQEFPADSARTGVIIQCPQEDLPIYVDGTLVGHTPLPDVILLNPGQHQIGFFPTLADSTDSVRTDPGPLPGMKTVRVERGYILPVQLDYRTLVRDTDLHRPLPAGGRWIGILLVFTMLGVTFWGIG